MKRVFGILIVLVLCLSFLESVSVFAQEQVTIEFWHPYGPPWDAVTNKTVDAFNKENPDIKVVAKMIPYDAMFQKLATAVASGQAPAVAHTWGSWTATQLANMGLTLPLDPYMKKDPEWNPKDIYPAFLQQFKYKGQYVGLPWAAQPTSICWNKQVFREVGLNPNTPPRSLKDIEVFSEKITLKDDKGKLIRIGFLPHDLWGGFFNWAYHWGGIFYDEKKNKITASDPVNVEALKWQVDFLDKFGGVEAITAWQSGFTGGENDPFLLGKLGIKLASHYHYYSFHVYKPDLDYGFAPPIFPGPPDRRKGPIAHTDSGVLLKCKYPEAGYRFLKFATVGEGILYTSFPLGAWASPNRKINEKGEKMGLLPSWYPKALWKQDLRVLEMARPHPVIPVIPQLMDQLRAQTDLAYRHKKTPEEALKYVDEVVQRELDKVMKQ